MAVSIASAGMSADERAELEGMHAHERQLTDELDRLDAELAESKERAANAEAEKQNIYDEFQSLQAQVVYQQTPAAVLFVNVCSAYIG